MVHFGGRIVLTVTALVAGALVGLFHGEAWGMAWAGALLGIGQLGLARWRGSWRDLIAAVFGFGGAAMGVAMLCVGPVEELRVVGVFCLGASSAIGLFDLILGAV